MTEEKKETRGLKTAGLSIHYRRIVQDNLRFRLKPQLPDLPRPQLAAYIQLKTGIGFLKPYLWRIGKRDDDTCNDCKKKQTVTHLLLNCKTYQNERKPLKKAALKDKNPLTLQWLLNTTQGKEALGQFLLSTKVATAQWIKTQ
jgi:hypothetical protein